MRHRVYGKHLGRTKNERNALFKNLIRALILHGSIETTEAKAKSIKGLVDKIITQAKSKNTQWLVSKFLVRKEIQEKLFKEIVPALKTRNSGYVSLVKLGRRLGDNTMKVRMSLLIDSEKLGKTRTAYTKQKTSVSDNQKSRNSDTRSYSESSEKVKPQIRKRATKK